MKELSPSASDFSVKQEKKYSNTGDDYHYPWTDWFPIELKDVPYGVSFHMLAYGYDDEYMRVHVGPSTALVDFRFLEGDAGMKVPRHPLVFSDNNFPGTSIPKWNVRIHGADTYHAPIVRIKTGEMFWMSCKKPCRIIGPIR